MARDLKGTKFTPSAYMEPAPLIREIVAAHQRRQPELGIRLGIWLNPMQNLLKIWGQGVDLLEILESPGQESPEFMPQAVPANADNPPLRLIRTGLAALKAARASGHAFVVDLEAKLKVGSVEVVFPEEVGKSAFDAYSELL